MSQNLDQNRITECAGTSCPPFSLTVLDKVTSTNDTAKAMLSEDPAGSDPFVVIADSQTAGRGRLGRSFASPAGTGIYMSVGIGDSSELWPGAERTGFVTMAAAVAVCRAVERVCPDADPPVIKWVNDIYIRGKKVCGILAEACADPRTGAVSGIVIGIGINCFPGSFPEELTEIAGPVSETAGSFSRSGLAGFVIGELLELLRNLRGFSPTAVVTDEYRKRCFVIGKEITVYDAAEVIHGEGRRAKALSVTDDGGLEVEFLTTGAREVLHSGEVSIR